MYLYNSAFIFFSSFEVFQLKPGEVKPEAQWVAPWLDGLDGSQLCTWIT